MNEVDAVKNHWAVLIGINFYGKPLKDEKPLKGCVRDVESIKQYLEAGSTPLNVCTFTASEPSDPNSRHPAEKPDSWPTFENVTSSLTKIIAEAQPGDLCISIALDMGRERMLPLRNTATRIYRRSDFSSV